MAWACATKSAPAADCVTWATASVACGSGRLSGGTANWCSPAKLEQGAAGHQHRERGGSLQQGADLDGGGEEVLAVVQHKQECR